MSPLCQAALPLPLCGIVCGIPANFYEQLPWSQSLSWLCFNPLLEVAAMSATHCIALLTAFLASFELFSDVVSMTMDQQGQFLSTLVYKHPAFCRCWHYHCHPVCWPVATLLSSFFKHNSHCIRCIPTHFWTFDHHVSASVGVYPAWPPIVFHCLRHILLRLTGFRVSTC